MTQINNIGDRLVSFGGYTFIADNTLKMHYPVDVRQQLITIPDADYAYNPYGTRRPPVKATDLTFDYWLDRTAAGVEFATNAALKLELAKIKDALYGVGTGTLVTQERDGTTQYSASAVFENLETEILSEHLTNLTITLVFTPLTPFS